MNGHQLLKIFLNGNQQGMVTGWDRDQKEMVIDDSVLTCKTAFTIHFTAAKEKDKSFSLKKD